MYLVFPGTRMNAAIARLVSGPVGRWHFLCTLVNTQPAVGESWTYKLYVKPVAFLVLWWLWGCGCTQDLFRIMPCFVNSCPFLQVLLCTTNSVSALCFLNLVFCVLVHVHLLFPCFTSEPPVSRCPGLHTAECTGWDCQYSAPIVPAIVHSLFVIASAPVWSAK